MHIDKSPILAGVEALRIVVAQPEDIPALQSTAATAWWATYREYLDACFIEDFLASAYSTRTLSLHLVDPSTLFLAAKVEGTLIGFGQVGPTLARDDDAPVAPADLYRLYLLPQWQGRGIGARLLGVLEGWLREREYLTYGAYVHEYNETAKSFYARQGFTHHPECDVQNEWYLVKRLDV